MAVPDEVLTQEQVLSPEYGATTQEAQIDEQTEDCLGNREFDAFLHELNDKFDHYFTDDNRFCGAEIDEIKRTIKEKGCDEKEKRTYKNIKKRIRQHAKWYDYVFNNRLDDPAELVKLKRAIPQIDQLQKDITNFCQALKAKNEDCPPTPIVDTNEDPSFLLFYNNTPSFSRTQSLPRSTSGATIKLDSEKKVEKENAALERASSWQLSPPSIPLTYLRDSASTKKPETGTQDDDVRINKKKRKKSGSESQK